MISLFLFRQDHSRLNSSYEDILPYGSGKKIFFSLLFRFFSRIWRQTLTIPADGKKMDFRLTKQDAAEVIRVRRENEFRSMEARA